ncbi:MAG: phosphoglucomutase/phosphomannomutase family protein [Candidatus Melainabacteria bacterium]|nr:phosphoglucomutase/phosphomannomutase family protein [Candidatus Melainabacteria bacterium]
MKFGTDGWRGVIAKDFTFENISLVSIACAEQFLEDLKYKSDINNLVFIGYDRRFLGKEFAERVATIFSAKGLNVNLYNQDVPTPMISFDVKKNNALGGIVITASHNPPEFSGFKVKMPGGCSASKDYTNKIEKRLEILHATPLLQINNYKTIDPSKDYISYIKQTLDIEKLKNINETVIIDSMHGTGGNYIESFLSDGKIKVKTIRRERDVNFGGINPEPMMPQLLPLSEEVIKNRAFIGLATDGDADRVGAIDENGEYINTHKILSLLLYYLVEKKKLSGGVVITFSQSVLVKKMAQKYGLKLYEVPIGFKHIADLMLKDNILIGGEEANGIGCKLHFMPERDGIFNALLLLEAVNSFGLKPSKLIEQLHKKFGEFYYDRIDLHIPKTKMGKDFVEKIKSSPPKEVNNLKVKEVQTLDGTKLIFEDDSWLLFRASGTEPLLRIYSEAKSKNNVVENLKTGESLFSLICPSLQAQHLVH